MSDRVLLDLLDLIDEFNTKTGNIEPVLAKAAKLRQRFYPKSCENCGIKRPKPKNCTKCVPFINELP
jgi:hypothetical protein